MHDKSLAVVSCVNHRSVDTLRAYLATEPSQTFDVAGKNIHDKRSLIAEVERSVQGPDAARDTNNWDAFADNLWWALTRLGQSRVAILWLDAHLMLNGLLPMLLDAVGCIEQVAQSVADSRTGSPRAIRFHLVLIGEGPNFPDFAYVPPDAPSP